MCCYQRGIRYGQGSREWLDLLVPDPESSTAPGFFAGLYRMARNRPVAVPEGVQEAVLFIHGGAAAVVSCCAVVGIVATGGWVAPGSDVQLQQLTAMARAGHVVFTMNYPLAPAHR